MATTRKQAPITGRFAPTPSGRMHLGNAFSCLMAWLDARSTGGKVVLRIEDLDPRARSRERAELLMDDLAWLGLDWDEGPFYQSERGDFYAQAAARLGAQGLTYPCFCTRAELHAATAPHVSDGTYIYQGTCRNLSAVEVAAKAKLRPPALRLRVPDAGDPRGTISFTDLAYGPQTEVLAAECGDFLIRRTDKVWAYQLAVVVDDALMGITHVVRGNDLLGSTARQLYIARLLGLPEPSYGHVPLLVAPDGRRLSKRDRDLDLGTLRTHGVSAERIVGLLGSLAGFIDTGEALRPDDLVGLFSWQTLGEQPRALVISPDEIAPLLA